MVPVGRSGASSSRIARSLLWWRVTDVAGCVRCGAADGNVPRLTLGCWVAIGRASFGAVDAAPLLRGGLRRRARLGAAASDGVARDLCCLVAVARRGWWRLGGAAEALGNHRRGIAVGRPFGQLSQHLVHTRVVDVAPRGGDQVQRGHRDRAVGEDRQRRRSAQCRGGTGGAGPLAAGHHAGAGGVVLERHQRRGIDGHPCLADGVAADH